MPLSIDKLNQLLEKKGFMCRKFFIDQHYCRFIEILSINTIDSYLLYIPSKYKFEPRVSDKHNQYKIKAIPIIKPENLEEKYAGKLEHKKVADNYDEIELQSQFPHQIKNSDAIDMEAQLTEQYRRPIVLKDVNDEDNSILQCIFRQLKRLQLCVQFLKYKFAIVYKNYLVVLHANETIECFTIKHFNEMEQRQLYITIDLEVFYENSKILINDLEQLQNGIRAVLDKNQDIQNKHLSIMIQKQTQLVNVLTMLEKKKLKLRHDLLSFKDLFKTIESSIVIYLKKLNEKNVEIQQTTGTRQEVLIREKHKQYIKLMSLYTKKEEVASAIIQIRKYEHHISLNIDRILFDNNVMLDKIFKNLIQLTNLIK